MAPARTVRLAAGGEFDLIRSFLGRGGEAPAPAGVRVGPGDDCAIVEGGPLALTCDASVEDVHFRRNWFSPEEIGWRAATASLSDLAAVAAEPLALLVALAVTAEDAASGWALSVMGGVHEAAGAAGAAVVGGDLTRSPGPALLDVVAVGRAASPVLRDGATAGDEVWVTGALGAAGAAVALLARGRSPSAPLRAALARPLPRWREALWLAERAPLHAMIDLSDGLAGDAAHLAAASGVALVLEGASVPLASGTEEAAGSGEERLRLALEGGEDYELLMAAPPGALEPLAPAFRERFGVPLTRVGEVTGGQGVLVRGPEGGPPRAARGGFDHFRGAGDPPAGGGDAA